MRILGRAIVVLFIGCIVLCGFTVTKGMAEYDDTYPEFQFDSERVEMELGDGSEKLLSGVTAYDAKDGDLTSGIFIESISNFIEPGVAHVTYVVYDSNNHAAKATRTVEYMDYTSPKFILNHSTIFHVGDKVNLTDFISATDIIDGNISDNVRFSTSSIVTSAEGLQSLTVRVTNSKGDTSELDLSIRVYGDAKTAPEIELTQYILYLEAGKSFSAQSFIKSVTKADGTELPVSGVTIGNNVRSNEPGVYSVMYTVQDENGNEGMSELIVVVEGKEGDQ